MKERPILFKGDMVTAILDGRKTQTRRVLNPQPAQDGPLTWSDATQGWWGFTSARIPLTKTWRCPYGVPGDRLWVREGFNATWCDHVIYKADDPSGRAAREAGYAREPRWKPSIHMPRKFSRITLDVLDVHVERVQDITEQDIHAEGTRVVYPPGYAFTGPRSPFGYQAWVNLWDTINAKRGFGWDMNPWVWVVKFRSASSAPQS